MTAFAARVLVLTVCLGSFACGGGEGFVDEPWEDEEWADDTAQASAPLLLNPRVIEAVPDDGRGGRSPVTVAVPGGVVGGSSPDPIPARQAVTGAVEDRRFEFQFPECEPFPAGPWREACNRSLGGRGR